VSKCTDCKGTGEYFGLFAKEACKACGGTGDAPDAPARTYNMYTLVHKSDDKIQPACYQGGLVWMWGTMPYRGHLREPRIYVFDLSEMADTVRQRYYDKCGKEIFVAPCETDKIEQASIDDVAREMNLDPNMLKPGVYFKTAKVTITSVFV
jgi:RecJ-like exonuclease